MNHKELVNRVAGMTGHPSAVVQKVLDGLTIATAAHVVDGDDVKIAGLGIFRKREIKARTARNPHTGETIQIPAKAKVKFIPAKSLKEAVL